MSQPEQRRVDARPTDSSSDEVLHSAMELFETLYGHTVAAAEWAAAQKWIDDGSPPPTRPADTQEKSEGYD